MKRTLSFFLLFLCFLPLFSQNLDQVGKDKKVVKLNGGISTSHIFYAASGLENRRNPYDYFVTGNIGLDIYGWSAPFSFTFSNQQVNFQQPFNQYGLHPTYKWIKTHLGWNSMSFSPYTLAGHLYNGVGFELTPTENWNVSVMYGRLQKAVALDTLQANNLPAFRRMGTGFKVGYKKQKDGVELIAFRAWDKENSITIPDSIGLAPQENLVLSIHATKSFLEKALLDVEFASSAITEDLRSGLLSDSSSKKNIYTNLGDIFRPRTSTAVYHAFKSSLSYPLKFMTIGATYERVEPGYRTLGAYFFNNDLENITLNLSTKLFKKISLSSNLGTQRNDLYNQKASQMRRFVGSVNASLALNKKMNLTASYSNFQSYTNVRSVFDQINQTTPFQNLDTLRYRQISQNASLSFNYALSKTQTSSQMLLASLVYQTSKDEQGGKDRNTGVEFYNVNVAHNLSLSSSGASIATSFAFNRNETLGQASTTFGPNVAFSRPFFKKQLKASLSSAFNNAYRAGSLASSVLNLRLSGQYTLLKKHNFSASSILLRKNTRNTLNANNFNELTATFAYSYNF